MTLIEEAKGLHQSQPCCSRAHHPRGQGCLFHQFLDGRTVDFLSPHGCLVHYLSKWCHMPGDRTCRLAQVNLSSPLMLTGEINTGANGRGKGVPQSKSGHCGLNEVGHRRVEGKQNNKTMEAISWVLNCRNLSKTAYTEKTWDFFFLIISSPHKIWGHENCNHKPRTKRT